GGDMGYGDGTAKCLPDNGRRPRHWCRPMCDYRNLACSPHASASPCRSINLAIRCRLHAVELRVQASFGHELVMRSSLGNPGAVQHDDEIRHAHGRESVGYKNGDATTVDLTIPGDPPFACRAGVALE